MVIVIRKHICKTPKHFDDGFKAFVFLMPVPLTHNLLCFFFWYKNRQNITGINMNNKK